MKLEEMVGQQLMIGIPGDALTPETIQLFRDTHAGGLIIFRPNFKSAEDFCRLIAGLETALGRRLLVAVDHEGGRVIHLAEGITVFPDNLALGQTANEDFARRQGEIEACELRRLGIDLNLAPTVDVLTENFSPNIGIRSYGHNAKLVSRLAVARIQGMQSCGLSACAKHFPGQGHSSIDAHLGLPVLKSPLKEMREKHFLPFAGAIEAGVDAIMSSHPVYPLLDPAKIPATFSDKIIRGLLRDELGFRGVILSDDLEMGALRNLGTIAEAAVRAVHAGHDMVLICHDHNAAREAYTKLLKAYQSGDLEIAGLELSIRRIQQLKQKRKNRFEGGIPRPETGGETLARQIARVGIKRDFENRIVARKTEAGLSVIFPRLSELKDRIFMEPEMCDEARWIRKVVEGVGLNVRQVCVVGLEPTGDELEQTRQMIENSPFTLYFCYDAHLYQGQKRILELLQNQIASGADGAVVFLRDPYDHELLSENLLFIDAFGFRICQLQAALEALFLPSFSLKSKT